MTGSTPPSAAGVGETAALDAGLPEGAGVAAAAFAPGGAVLVGAVVVQP
jgi:hypothetical protein